MLVREVSEHMDVQRDAPPALTRMEAWTPGSNRCRQFLQLCAKHLTVCVCVASLPPTPFFLLFLFKLDRCLNNMIGPPAARDCWGSVLQRPEWNMGVLRAAGGAAMRWNRK